MNNSDFQKLLQKHPDDMEIRLRVEGLTIHTFDKDYLLHTSETASIIEQSEDYEGEEKIDLGTGKQYLLINPLID